MANFCHQMHTYIVKKNKNPVRAALNTGRMFSVYDK